MRLYRMGFVAALSCLILLTRALTNSHASILLEAGSTERINIASGN